jgi:membrane protease YdiL (CAAX protease family)
MTAIREDQLERKERAIIAWRNRIGRVFRQNPLAISAELFVVVGLHALEVKDFPAILFSFPLGWISLWLRKLGWRGVGLRRPTSWLRTLGLGALIGIVYQLFEILLIDPLVALSTGAPLDYSQFRRLPGSIPNLVAWIIIGWLLAAFLEEMVLRGYLIRRFVDLLGDNRIGWTVGVLVSSVLFAVGHVNLGIASVAENFLFAAVFAGLYLAAGRNLWLPIIAHGFYNSLAFVLIYLGFNPSWFNL